MFSNKTLLVTKLMQLDPTLHDKALYLLSNDTLANLVKEFKDFGFVEDDFVEEREQKIRIRKKQYARTRKKLQNL